MKNTGTLRIRTFKKLPKSEVFISFNMEFRLKTTKNYLKSIKKPGTLRLVPSRTFSYLLVPSKNSRKNS